jgi:hypothetical protein
MNIRKKNQPKQDSSNSANPPSEQQNKSQH